MISIPRYPFTSPGKTKKGKTKLPFLDRIGSFVFFVFLSAGTSHMPGQHFLFDM